MKTVNKDFLKLIADIYDMEYVDFSLNGLTIKEIFVIIPLITLGNSLGGMLVPTIKLIFENHKYAKQYRGKYVLSSILHTFTSTGAELSVSSNITLKKMNLKV